MQAAYSQAVDNRVQSFNAGRVPDNVSDFMMPRFNDASAAQTGTNSPVMEELTMSPTQVSYQVGGVDVQFDDHLAPPIPPVDVESVEANRPMVLIDGVKWPLAYCKHTHRINEEGKLIMSGMSYEAHELVAENLQPEPEARTVPVFAHPADSVDFVPDFRGFLDTKSETTLAEPLVNLGIDTAFSLVDWNTGAYANRSVVKFTSLTTDAVLTSDREEVLETLKTLQVGSKESNINALRAVVKSVEGISYVLARKLDRAATAAFNEITLKRLALPFNFRIDSFVADSQEFMDNVDNYAPGTVKRFSEHLRLLKTVLCCLLTQELTSATLLQDPVARQLLEPTGLLWDAAERCYRVATKEELESLTEKKEEIEESLANRDGLVQVSSTDYCVLLPIEFEELGIELPLNQPIDVVPALVMPSVTPELCAFIHRVVKEAGGVDSYRRFLLGTVNGVVIQVHPTCGRDVDGEIIYGLEVILN